MKSILYFSSPTCAPCRALWPTVEQVAAEQGLKLTKYDITEAPSIARAYGVMAVPTVIVVKDGVPGDRLVGLYSKAKIEGLIGG